MKGKRVALQTKRLKLRTASQEEMRRWIDAQTDGVLASAYREMLAGCLAHPEQWAWYAMWMIELIDGTHVGELCFKGLGADGSAEIGYGISEAYRGRGYASEAVEAAVRWALRQPGAARVEAETEADNVASRRVLEKCGFLPSGTMGAEGSRFVRYAVNIRRARAGEMAEIMSLVCDTFDEQGIPRELNVIPAEHAPVWWCAEESGAVIGTIASYTEDGKTHLGRFAIRPERRGSGLGTKLLRFAIEDVFAHGAEKIYTESRPVTVKILEKMGAKASGETFPFYQGVCTPINLCREDYLPSEEETNRMTNTEADGAVKAPYMSFEEAVSTIPPGRYRHFKGKEYEVICIARHSETEEPMVVYKALYGDGGVWCRPAGMWNERITRDGIRYRRFYRLDRIERVEKYERLFDEATASPDPEKLRALDAYYTSGEWREDYEADERGELPPLLKRGVLSQDALYDLLERANDGK